MWKMMCIDRSMHSFLVVFKCIEYNFIMYKLYIDKKSNTLNSYKVINEKHGQTNGSLVCSKEHF
jgi:hypothetical protein